ncbi:MAG: hypothetical protein QOC82_437 [Frankiaceae bacterium]|nr:hypothetical protein [Frankiaceae bacterium]
MTGAGQQLDPKIQFFFYAFACLAFLGAAVIPAEGALRVLTKHNLLAVGLALAIAPSAYIFFKLGFHPSPFFH